MPAGRSIPGASRPRRSRPALDLLPNDALVATCDDARRVLPHVAVAVRGNRIAAVGATAAPKVGPAHAGLPRQPCRSLMLLPGPINAHTHTVLLALCGTVEDGKGEAIYRRMSPIFYAMSNAERELLAALGCLAAIRSGGTAREKRLG